MPEYWFEWLIRSGEERLASDLSEWAGKLDTASGMEEDFVPLHWETTVRRGLFTSRQEYLASLRRLCLMLGERRLSSALQKDDEQILRMVRTLDGVSGMIEHLTGRLVDWYGIFEPAFSRKDRYLRESALLARMKVGGDDTFRCCVEEGERLLSLRTTLSREVSRRAEVRYPNCSALVGGLVAARLIARAGGLDRLARMPSSTIQVLGAENALFSHLHAGTPAPKHGILYQHRRVHAASRALRGRVARVLAGRVALAARLDYYRETLDPTFVAESQARIDRAGEGK
jgi:nucleolar protein 56